MHPLTLDYAQAQLHPHPEYFDGKVTLQTLVPGDGQRELEVLGVWFMNGARTRPHVHTADQLLVVVQGRCVLANRTERVLLEAGESAVIPKGEWHWHGAAAGTMCHLSIKKPGPTDWDQPLYNFDE